jgi:hypothetical protein
MKWKRNENGMEILTEQEQELERKYLWKRDRNENDGSFPLTELERKYIPEQK